MLLLSLQTFVLFECKIPAKWTSLDIPPWFQFEANVYVPCKVHWIGRNMNLNCIYLQRYIFTHVRVWRRCAAQIHEWMFWSEVNYNGFPSILSIPSRTGWRCSLVRHRPIKRLQTPPPPPSALSRLHLQVHKSVLQQEYRKSSSKSQSARIWTCTARSERL